MLWAQPERIRWCDAYEIFGCSSSFCLFAYIRHNVEEKLRIKKISLGVPVIAQWLMNLTRNHEVAGSIPGLAQWVKDSALW